MIEFPLTQPKFEYHFGVRALPTGRIPFRKTGDFEDELNLKRKLLDARREEVFAANAESDAACRETAEWIVQTAPWVDSTISSEHPLIQAGLQVQEDIAVLRNDVAAGFPIIAGLVCFPSGWSIRDKLGSSVGQTHDDVPGFSEQMLQRTGQLFASLKPLRSVDRSNWMIAPSSELPMLPSDSEKNDALRRGATADTVGQRCYFRMEYQTLTRMPKTRSIVFTILTMRCKLMDLSDDRAAILRGVMRTIPQAVADYKRITPMRAALQEYLDQRVLTHRDGTNGDP